MKILVFDNYDSFTYNLVQLVSKINIGSVEVYRNDELPLEKVAKYDKIILSPGPGIPAEAGMLVPLIQAYAATKSILGVCLGHQAIGQSFGGELINLSKVYHGIATPIKIKSEVCGINSYLFRNLPDEFIVGRYHSWVVSDKNFPSELEITARDENGFVMALQHKQFDLQGVQFHPESVLTPNGKRILENWLKK